MDNDTTTMGDQVRFQTTRWNLVQSCRDVAALDTLIRIYWNPLYFFVRQHGYDNETAKDIVQGFLTTLLEKSTLTKADPHRGRFRTFLLTLMTNFLKDWSRAARTEKRGSGKTILSLDFARGEAEYVSEAKTGDSPETLLNRAWARSLWDQSLTELDGDPAHLEAFRLYLTKTSFEEICRKTGLTEAAAQSAIHRLKGRLRDIVVGHIRETVTTDEDLSAEVSDFTELLS